MNKNWKNFIFMIIMLVFILVRPVSAEENDAIITKFAMDPVNMMQIENKPEESVISNMLPEKIQVQLNDEEVFTDLAVEWQCVGDFDGTNYYYYQFVPVWDESEYLLEAGVEVPYVGVFLAGTTELASVTEESNETVIYNFLREELGLNEAASCGILANLYCESAFLPTAYNGNDSGSTQSYGICQWNSGTAAGNRYGALITWCGENNYDYKTLEGQLWYMKYELETTPYYKYSKLKNEVENTAGGAYEASKIWSVYFEGCASVYHEPRAELAMNTYWPEYAPDIDPTPVITGATKPGTLTKGDAFTISGIISAGVQLTEVSVGCYNADNELVIGKSAVPFGRTYDLSNLDAAIAFGTLEPGVYTYRVTAVTANETKTLVKKVFIVLSKERTVSNGIYQICAYEDETYAVGIYGNSMLKNKAAVLKNTVNSGTGLFYVKHNENGYYTIRNVKSGHYLTVKDGGTASGTTIIQTPRDESDAQLWQILPLSNGGYTLVPKCAKKTCLNIQDGNIAAGTVLEIKTANLKGCQTYKMKKIQYSMEDERDALQAPAKVIAKLTAYDDVNVTWEKAEGAAGYIVYYKKSTESTYTKLGNTIKNSYSIADLSDGVKYKFKIVPYIVYYGEKQVGPKGKTATVTTLKKMNTPVITKSTTSKVKVSWEGISAADGYQLSQAESKTETTSWGRTENTFEVIKAVRNKTLYYKVRAYTVVDGKRIYGPWSNVVSYKLRYVYPVTDAAAVLYGHDDVEVTWTKAAGANAYAVYYKKSSADKYTYLERVTETSYRKKNLADGAAYTFKIVPQYVSGGKVQLKGTADTASVTTLKKITGIGVKKNAAGQVTVSWKNIAGETGYQISRTTSKTKTNIVCTYKTTNGNSKILDTAKNTTYYYKVRAYKTVDGTKIYGPWSDVISFKLK